MSTRHAHAYCLMQAPIARSVVGPIRVPDLLRIGPASRYLHHVDLSDAVTVLTGILANRSWDRPAFQRRAAVT